MTIPLTLFLKCGPKASRLDKQMGLKCMQRMQGKNNYVLTLDIILEDSIDLVIIFGIIQASYRNLSYS